MTDTITLGMLVLAMGIASILAKSEQLDITSTLLVTIALLASVGLFLLIAFLTLYTAYCTIT